MGPTSSPGLHAGQGKCYSTVKAHFIPGVKGSTGCGFLSRTGCAPRPQNSVFTGHEFDVACRKDIPPGYSQCGRRELFFKPTPREDVAHFKGASPLRLINFLAAQEHDHKTRMPDPRVLYCLVQCLCIVILYTCTTIKGHARLHVLKRTS
jgi:hypothetical protein